MASTIEPLIYMAEQGVGIACLPDFAIGRQLREGVLVAVLDDYTDSGPMAVEPASRSQAQSVRGLPRREPFPAVEGEADRAGDSGMSS
jgi:DNA-binding transcriptional LysR family regulator